MLTLFLLTFLSSVNIMHGTCIEMSHSELLCTNEFEFNQNRPSVESLTLIDSYIAHSKLFFTFPSVKNIVVIGSFRRDQCRALVNDERYLLIGCDGELKNNKLKHSSLGTAKITTPRAHTQTHIHVNHNSLASALYQHPTLAL